VKLKLSQAADVRLGRQRAPQFETGEHPVRYLRSANIGENGINISDVKSMNFTPSEQSIYELVIGDVLLTEGSGSRSAVGQSAVWSGQLDGKTCFQNTLLRLRPRAGLTDGRYLAWWARHAHSSGQMAEAATGANILHLGSDGLKQLSLHVPPLEEQRRIADFLDERVPRIDNIIGARRDQMALVDLSYAGWVAEKADQMTNAYGSLPLRRYLERIEQGWSPVCDSRVAEPGEAGVIKLGAVRDGDFRPAENKAMAEGMDPDERYRLAEGDLLVTRANTLQLVGDSAVVGEVDGPNLYLSDLVYRITAPEADAHFLSVAIRTPRNRQIIAALARGASQSMAKLRGEDIADVLLPAAPIDVQSSFGVDDQTQRHLTRSRRRALSQSITLLAEYKESLITAAVTGELDVTTASRKVPA